MKLVSTFQDWLINTKGQFVLNNTMGSRFAKGVFWSSLGTVFTQVSTMAAAILIARVLGKVNFGEFGMVNNTIWMFWVFTGSGLGITATKYVAEWRKTDPKRAGRVIGLSNLAALISGGAIGIIFYYFAVPLSAKILNAPQLAGELKTSSILLLVYGFTATLTGALTGLEDFKSIGWVNVARGIISLPILVLGVWLYGLHGVIVGTVIIGIISLILFYLALRQGNRKAGIKTTYRNLRAEVPLLWKFSIPALLANLVNTPILWLAYTILVRQPDGYGEVGVLNGSNQWRTVLMFLPTIFIQVSLPLMSNALGDQETDTDFVNVLKISQSLTIMIVFPIATMIMFFSTWIMWLYGKSFIGGDVVLIGVVASVMIASVGATAGSAIQAKGKMWLSFFINLTWGAILIIFVWLTAQDLGAQSVAIGLSISYFVSTIWSLFYLAKSLPKRLIGRFFLALTFAILISLICYLLPPVDRLIAGVPVTILTLFLTLFVFIEPDTRQTLFRLIRLPERLYKPTTSVDISSSSTDL